MFDKALVIIFNILILVIMIGAVVLLAGLVVWAVANMVGGVL